MNALTPPCRVCQHKSTEVMDTIPLCGHHAVYVADNLVKVYQTPRQQCPIGIGRAIGDIDHAGLFPLRCDKSFGHGMVPHTWTGNIGDICYCCLREHVAMLADSYAYAIRRLDCDVDDARYQKEVISRGERLVTAVSIGLVPQSLATTLFDRWCSNV